MSRSTLNLDRLIHAVLRLITILFIQNDWFREFRGEMFVESHFLIFMGEEFNGKLNLLFEYECMSNEKRRKKFNLENFSSFFFF